jgi:hypothetical protein
MWSKFTLISSSSDWSSFWSSSASDSWEFESMSVEESLYLKKIWNTKKIISRLINFEKNLFKLNRKLQIYMSEFSLFRKEKNLLVKFNYIFSSIYFYFYFFALFYLQESNKLSGRWKWNGQLNVWWLMNRCVMCLCMQGGR